MVKGVFRLFFDNRSLCIYCQDFKRTAEGIQQDGKEQQGPTAVKAACVVGKVVENTPNNQGHDRVADYP